MATSWIAGMPQIITSSLTETSVQASGSMNQAGIIAMVIVPVASGEPSAAQIYAGQDSDGNALPPQYKDDKAVSASGAYVVLDGGPYLSPGTDYTMWVVGMGESEGLMAAGSGLNFTTYQASASASASESVSSSKSASASESVSPSKSVSASSSKSASTSESVSASKSESASASAGAAPAWVTGYPAVGTITLNSAVASFKIDDAGVCYMVIVPATESAPSVAQIKQGKNAAGTTVAAGLRATKTLVANTVATQAITGMHYSVNYVGYFVAEDNFGQATTPAIETVAFRALVPKPGVPGRYSMSRIVRDRQRLGNQIFNTLRGR